MPGSTRQCNTCRTEFLIPPRPGRPPAYCSDACRHEGFRLSANRSYHRMREATPKCTHLRYGTCDSCSQLFVRSAQSFAQTLRSSGATRCRSCSHRINQETSNRRERNNRVVWRMTNDPRYLRLRTRENHKCHKRRVKATRYSDLRGSDIYRIKKRAKVCELCGETLSEDFTYRHLDHIWPIHAGGTHTRDNVRVLCRSCNLKRPKDGSDVSDFQLNLWMVR